jgi:hypothetical protein
MRVPCQVVVALEVVAIAGSFWSKFAVNLPDDRRSECAQARA